MILNTILAMTWMQGGQLLLSLSILVILHEFGHYITAKWFGVRVEKFYLFFDPWFSLFKKKVGDTEYGVGWLPLGGYVKLAGMIDESMDKEQMKQPAQPWEFRSKPAWQRLIIMLGGIIMNVLVAIFVYAMILFKWGEDKIPNASIKDGLAVADSTFMEIGLRTGDKIVAIAGEKIEYFDDVLPKMLLAGGKTIEVDRNGKIETFNVRKDFVGQLASKKLAKGSALAPRVPAYVGEYEGDTTNAQKAGIRPMDKIVGIDSVVINYRDEMAGYLDKKKNQTVNISVLRKSDTLIIPVKVDSLGKIGILGLNGEQYGSLGIYKIEHKPYGFFESLPAGLKLTGRKLKDYIDQFKLMLTPGTGAAKGLGGFMSMGSIFSPNKWVWEHFWNITALFSIILAFMNLLPIPALDGGHVVFTLYEMIFRRKPSDKFMEYALIVGMILLFGLMLYANGNDIYRWWKGL